MHELSIAMSIIEMVEDEAERLGGRRVTAIHLRVGRLAGIVHDALRSSFAMATEDSALAGTRLVIDDVPVLVQCPTCQGPRAIRSAQDFRCIDCGTPAGDVVAGRELLVTALEMQP
jgi:hydrogenase nickel incorporation protein HypA/HybF